MLILFPITTLFSVVFIPIIDYSHNYMIVPAEMYRFVNLYELPISHSTIWQGILLWNLEIADENIAMKYYKLLRYAGFVIP